MTVNESNNRDSTISIRLTSNERKSMEEIAKNSGFKTISDYLRFLHNAHTQQVNSDQKKWIDTIPKERKIQEFFRTDLGVMYCGDSLDYLFNVAEEESVDLIMTSPPFGLVRKKQYGNEDADKYCDWFRPFAEGFKRVLKESGSLVIDIGGSWIPGMPTRSLYHFELLIMLVKEYGFYLCQEHYWWNPSKLPTPAEWVNIRRVRVKDAVNTVWWLSKTPYPKANNRRVLVPYSESMLDLLENGYQAKERPSGHVISKKFAKDNGGAVPPNLLAIANTESTGQYQEYCRKNGLPIHPARFPEKLPEYFIKFLTDPGDLVLDPFAGSCVTGKVAEQLNRRWVCVELNAGYLQGAVSRFTDDDDNAAQHATKNKNSEKSKSKHVKYEIWAPCSLPINDDIPLIEDGGRHRQQS
ncbi:DNA-methyltransferase [Parageobacillus thermoglucosidasius]|uniref:DNA-methyltransferase n=1 Tax=Parageobacillus thermoglucosidasius TaxID=1426 RepID=UPI000B5841D4|nr:site-specific DNA-methyltransferase [Parageobacillus thermoglucosidasius]OUM89020.1 MAG: DNA methylase [Parageobacillus thermoglucosidasius]